MTAVTKALRAETIDTVINDERKKLAKRCERNMMDIMMSEYGDRREVTFVNQLMIQ
jgi:hypothetical protein